jgi:hypothetical protein
MAAPATPANLAVALTASNCLKLTWDNVANETGFNLYKSFDGGSNYELCMILDTDVLEHYDFDVDESTEYYYKISAFNGDGESALSASVNDTTLASSLKDSWHAGVKKIYDTNAFYLGLSDDVSMVGLRSETTLRSDTTPSEDEDVIRLADISTSIKLDDLAAPDDNTDLDASTSTHGLVVKCTAPAAGTLNVVGIGNGETAYTNKTLFDATNPANLGTAAPGSSLYAAHRDHVHQQGANVADASASHSITDPADSPADADALRDDLVTNAIPEIESALDALGTKVNAILASLEAAGIMASS